MHRRSAAALLAAVLAAGCGQDSGAPASPSEVTPGAHTAAAEDGSTLKVSAPAPASPADGAVIKTLQPALNLRASKTLFPEAGEPALSYRYQVFLGGAPVLNVLRKALTWQVPGPLRHATTYRWRARAEMDGAVGPWSAMTSFRTPNRPPGTVLPPGPYPRSGPGVAAYVMRHWPDRLRARTGMGTRTRHMEFLRDRMIEVARCGGLDVAWNLKRGVGPRSHDAIAWRTRGRVEVVDIALAFKDPSRPLHLHWNITRGPSGYQRYSRPFYCQ